MNHIFAIKKPEICVDLKFLQDFFENAVIKQMRPLIYFQKQKNTKKQLPVLSCKKIMKRQKLII